MHSLHPQLCRRLVARQHRPLVLTRGYGNDEHHMLAAHLPSCVVAAAKDRVSAALAALTAHPELTVAVLDDGLQQRRLKAHLSIVMRAFR